MMGVTDIPIEIFKVFVRPSASEGSEPGEPSEPSEPSRPSQPESQSNATHGDQTFTRSDATSHLESPETVKRSESSTVSQKEKTFVRKQPTVEDAADATRGLGRIVGSGLRSPMDFTMSLATGFRNAPKLYGDETVRDIDRVTGLKSGLRVAGKVQLSTHAESCF